jgi:hypothetical protein
MATPSADRAANKTEKDEQDRLTEPLARTNET